MTEQKMSTGRESLQVLDSFSEKPIQEYIISPDEFYAMFSESSDMSLELLQEAFRINGADSGSDKVTLELLVNVIMTAYRSGVYSGYTRGLTDGVKLYFFAREEERKTWEAKENFLS